MIVYPVMFEVEGSVDPKETYQVIESHGGKMLKFEDAASRCEPGKHLFVVDFPRAGDPRHDATAMLSAIFGADASEDVEDMNELAQFELGLK